MASKVAALAQQADSAKQVRINDDMLLIGPKIQKMLSRRASESNFAQKYNAEQDKTAKPPWPVEARLEPSVDAHFRWRLDI